MRRPNRQKVWVTSARCREFENFRSESNARCWRGARWNRHSSKERAKQPCRPNPSDRVAPSGTGELGNARGIHIRARGRKWIRSDRLQLRSMRASRINELARAKAPQRAVCCVVSTDGRINRHRRLGPRPTGKATSNELVSVSSDSLFSEARLVILGTTLPTSPAFNPSARRSLFKTTRSVLWSLCPSYFRRRCLVLFCRA